MAYIISDKEKTQVDLKSARSAVLNSLNLTDLNADEEESEIVNNYVKASKSVLNTYGIRQEIAMTF